jgi:hypothetical protein
VIVVLILVNHRIDLRLKKNNKVLWMNGGRFYVAVLDWSEAIDEKKGRFYWLYYIWACLALQVAFIESKSKGFIKNMKNIGLLVLLALTATLCRADLGFDLNSASYQSVSGFWDLSIPVTGGINPLTYSYQTLPTTWIQSGNNLEIPTIATAAGGTWAIKVIVSDALGNQLQRSLLIKISGGAIYIGDYPYNQTFTFSASGAATVSPASSTFLTTSTPTYSSSGSASNSVVRDQTNTFGNPSSTAGVISLRA